MSSESVESQSGHIQCFVFFDSETTGLPSPGNNPRITELCFMALTRDELTLEHSSPRAVNKLILCFNPRKMIGPHTTMITGLHNDSLEQLATFRTQAPLVCDFLKNLPQPTCLVAHNGNGFDFPLLVAQLNIAGVEVPPGVLCADSLEAFRCLDGLPPQPEFVSQKPKNRAAWTTAVQTTPQDAITHCPQVLSNDDSVRVGMPEQKAEVSDASPHDSTGDRPQTQPASADLKVARKRDLAISSAELSGPFEEKIEIVGISTPIRKNPKVDPTLVEKRPTDVDVDQNLLAGTRRQLFPETSSEISRGGDNPETDVLRNIPVDDKSNLDRFPSLTEDDETLMMQATLQAESKLTEHNNMSHEPSTMQNGSAKEANSSTESSLCNQTVGTKCNETPAAASSKSKKSVPAKVSYSLPKIYCRVFGQEPAVSHTAEDDCVTLVKIVRGSAIEDFPAWCDKHAVSLRSLAPMY